MSLYKTSIYFKLLRLQLEDIEVSVKNDSGGMISRKEIVLLHAKHFNNDISKFFLKDGVLSKKRLLRYAKKVIESKKPKKKSHKEKYYTYLLSCKWRKIRTKIIKERKSCERCGSKIILQLHHKTYENIFNEKDEDLELLCRKCHKLEHEIK